VFESEKKYAIILFVLYKVNINMTTNSVSHRDMGVDYNVVSLFSETKIVPPILIIGVDYNKVKGKSFTAPTKVGVLL
jgi:hypothetical protein